MDNMYIKFELVDVCLSRGNVYIFATFPDAVWNQYRAQFRIPKTCHFHKRKLEMSCYFPFIYCNMVFPGHFIL